MPDTTTRHHWAPGVDGSFAQLIFNERKARGWTQLDLAGHSGVSRETIRHWEKGNASRPDPASIRAVCAALDVATPRALIALGYLTADDLAPAA